MRSVLALLVGAVALLSPLLFAVQGGQARSRRAPSVVLPGDYEPQSTLLVAWDENYQEFFVSLVAAAYKSAKVVILLDLEQDYDVITAALLDAGVDLDRLTVINIPVDSVWMRDYGPLAVRYSDGTRGLIDTRYHGKGADDEMPHAVGDLLYPSWPVVEMPVQMEGGNLLSDGKGACITTTQTFELLTPRERTKARAEIQRRLGCRKLIVLQPMAGEDTGHADMFVLLTGPRRALVGRYTVRQDIDNAKLLDDNARTLRRHGFKVDRIPMPGNHDGIYRSYTQALPLNEIVIAPVYADSMENEAAALAKLHTAFPGRKIVPVESSTIIEMAGAVHCTTMGIAP